MRWIALVTFLSAMVLASGAPARAATGFDSAYFGESSFLNLNPGQSGQFAAGFNNTGSIGWQTGTASQVNLAICSADKTTCNVASPNAGWASSWYSSMAYATQSTLFVGPGQTGWFVYSVTAPAGTAAGTSARFSGEVVLASTGERLRPEGYYQDASVAGAGTVPTRIEAQPIYQTAQIGRFPLVTATVTADPPAGSSVRAPVANIAVVFEISTSATFNPPLTFTAVTNASGQASITYTRNNPGTDTVVPYVAGTPSVRTTATVVWGLSGGAISVIPDDATTRANDATGCRAYSFTATNPSTGAPYNAVVLHVNFLENINRTVDKDGGATIVGDTTGSPTPTTAIAKTTAADGTGTFSVCGNGSTASVTPILFDNASNSDPNLLETGDKADTGGTITFQLRQASITVTPADAGTRVSGDQRVYTIVAVDQFGAAYIGPVRISFLEVQDNDPATTASAFITWYDNDNSLAVVGVSGSGAPAGTTDISDTQNFLLPALNSAGQATFGIYAPNTGSGRPVVFVDTNGNSALDTGEPSGLGGSTTWSQSTFSGCTLTKSKPLLPTSTGSANAGILSEGDVFMVFTFRDQSGTAITPPSPAVVTFSVANGGSATIAARTEGRSSDTLISAGGSAPQPTPNPVGTTTAYMILDSAGATSATVSASATSGGVTVSCGPVNVRWVVANAEPTSGSLTGTVTDFDKGSSTSDGGAYVLHTAGGDYVISYSPGQPLILTGASATEAEFEAALSLGDTILWSYNNGAESHNIITNN